MNPTSMEISPETVYTDLVGMPAQMLAGFTIRYYNNTDSNLYMKVEGAGPTGWSSNSVELGVLSALSSAYRNLDNFLSREKPVAEATEVLTIILRAYSDSGYTNLLYSYSQTATIVIIKSDDGTWTQDELDNFDGGTVEGWAVAYEEGTGAYCTVDGYPIIAVDNTYSLSPPNSCLMTQKVRVGGPFHTYCRSRMYKSFSTPDKGTIYAILNIRNEGATSPAFWAALKNIKVSKDGTVDIYIGRPEDSVNENYFPEQWMRMVIPLPRNTSVEIRIIVEAHCYHNSDANSICYYYTWIDDIKIISK